MPWYELLSQTVGWTDVWRVIYYSHFKRYLMSNSGVILVDTSWGYMYMATIPGNKSENEICWVK